MMEPQVFLTIIKNTPLISIDLLLYDDRGRVLLGWRNNRPAKDTWFVPGGRINKNERFDDAFRRISIVETGEAMEQSNANFMGVFQHLYEDNALGEPGVGTHYLVLAFQILLGRELTSLPKEQHSQYRWMLPEELLADPQVHPNTKAYFGQNWQSTFIASGRPNGLVTDSS